MRAEREKLNAKITAGALKLSGGRLELPAEMCHIVLFSGGSCTVQCGDTSLLVSPGCALLLGPGGWYRRQATPSRKCWGASSRWQCSTR